MVADLHAVDVDFAEDEFAAEQFLEDQRGDPALSTGRIVRSPFR
ncbi:hypothetical protein Q0Z83_008910 [Actinoplanes sichuanensis]|nr:hypothetical protein Q0Z83_008910 [Actinoplanes sichuanensis]